MALQSQDGGVNRMAWNKRFIKEKFVAEEIKMSRKVAKKSKYRQEKNISLTADNERKLDENTNFSLKIRISIYRNDIFLFFFFEFITSYTLFYCLHFVWAPIYITTNTQTFLCRFASLMAWNFKKRKQKCAIVNVVTGKIDENEKNAESYSKSRK